MSAVLYPSAKAASTDFSIASASSFMPKESLSIIAVLSIHPIGLAIPLPAMSWALPCIGSYKLTLVRLRDLPGRLDKLADGSIPIDPDRTEASSVRISPKVFSETITSKSEGFLINCMAALSTRTWSNSTSG